MWRWLGVIVLSVGLLIGCAPNASQVVGGPQLTSVQQAEATTYEGVALALNAAKGYIKGQELSGALKGQQLDDTIAKWEQARLLFLKAGDALKASVAASSPADQKTLLQQYNQLLMQASQAAGQLKGGK